MTIAIGAVIYIADCAATLLAIWNRGLMRYWMIMYKVRDVMGKEDVEEWPKDGSLWYSTFY